MVAWKHLFSCWERKVLFSTIAKPWMFGLAMMLKENFFAYWTQFVFLIKKFVPENVVMVALDMCRTSPINEKWIYVQNMYSVLCFCLFTYLFNVCLIIFLFFYIWNVWFVLANTRILIFLILKFVAMFLPVSMNKFCN